MEPVKTFNEYGPLAFNLANYGAGLKNLNNGSFVIESVSSLYPFLALGGEVGEIQEKIKKVIRDSKGIISPETREALIKELGDVLWYINACAIELGSSLQEVANMNLEKLYSRANRGTLHGSGDNR